jgi:hypothetical protein
VGEGTSPQRGHLHKAYVCCAVVNSFSGFKDFGVFLFLLFFFCPDGETKSLPNPGGEGGGEKKSIPKKQTNCIFIISLSLFSKKREKILKNWRIEKCQEGKKIGMPGHYLCGLFHWLQMFTQSLHDMLQQ